MVDAEFTEVDDDKKKSGLIAGARRAQVIRERFHPRADARGCNFAGTMGGRIKYGCRGAVN